MRGGLLPCWTSPADLIRRAAVVQAADDDLGLLGAPSVSDGEPSTADIHHVRPSPGTTDTS